MRTCLSLPVLFLILSGIAYAQRTPVELRFEKNKQRYTREHFVSGEDASSGYDYLFYRSGKKIVMIRSIWSATHTSELRITDYYFDPEITFIRRSTGRKRNLNALKSGRTAPLRTTEEMEFANGKLIRWIEKGKPADPNDARWSQTEKGNVENAKAELEGYDFLKNDN